MNHDFLFLTRDYDSLPKTSLSQFKLSSDALSSISEKIDQIKRYSKANAQSRPRGVPMPEETPSNIQYSLLLRSDKEATIIKMEDKCYTSTPFIDSISQDNLETSSDKKFQIEVQMISTPGNHEMQPLKMGSCRRYIRKMRPKKYTETKLFNPNNIISEEDIEAERKKREATTINMKKPFVITKVPREVPTEDFQVPQNIDIALLIEE